MGIDNKQNQGDRHKAGGKTQSQKSPFHAGRGLLFRDGPEQLTTQILPKLIHLNIRFGEIPQSFC